MAGQPFDKAGIHFAMGDIPWKAATNNMYMALAEATPSQAAAEVIGDITQITGTLGYTTCGKAMTLNDPVVVPASGATSAYTKLYGSNVVWAAFSATASYAVIYIKTTEAETSYVVGYLDIRDPDTGNPQVGEGGTFTVICPTDGWFNIQTPTQT